MTASQWKTVLIVVAGIAILALALVAHTLTANRPSPLERTARMPGDAWIPTAMFATTQALTIKAPRERVWSWIAQMGAGRAGWYSYDVVDNGGTPSATVVLTEFQKIATGDLLPAVPGATDGFIVLAVDPPNSLVLGGPPDSLRGQRATWAFLLTPVGGAATRLIVRGRVAEHWLTAAPPTDPAKPRFFIQRIYGFMARLPKPVLLGFAGFGHRVMQNERLRGLKRRAER
jgi:hypothetical protein